MPAVTFTPGQLTRTQAEALNRLLEQVERLQFAFDRLADQQVLMQVQAKITDYDEGSKSYSWTQQTFDPSTGEPIDMPNPLKGSPSIMPAKERNGLVLPIMPAYRLLTYRTDSAGKSVYWEFDYVELPCATGSGGSGMASGSGCCAKTLAVKVDTLPGFQPGVVQYPRKNAADCWELVTPGQCAGSGS